MRDEEIEREKAEVWSCVLYKAYGRILPPIRFNQEYERLIVSALLHQSFRHLLFNILSHFVLLRLTIAQHQVSELLFVTFYSIIAGNVISGVYMPDTISVGSSGFVFGLLGLYVADLVLRLVYLPSEGVFDWGLKLFSKRESSKKGGLDSQEMSQQSKVTQDYHNCQGSEQISRSFRNKRKPNVVVKSLASLLKKGMKLADFPDSLKLTLIVVFLVAITLLSEADHLNHYVGLCTGLLVGLVRFFTIKIEVSCFEEKHSNSSPKNVRESSSDEISNEETTKNKKKLFRNIIFAIKMLLLVVPLVHLIYIFGFYGKDEDMAAAVLNMGCEI